MKKINTLFTLLCILVFTRCTFNNTNVVGDEIVEKLEQYKQGTTKYPFTLQGNIIDTKKDIAKDYTIKYVVDSSRTSYTLTIISNDGNEKIFDSNSKMWK